jgi:hypothetical protein
MHDAAAIAKWCVRLEESVCNDGIVTALDTTARSEAPTTSIFLHNPCDHEEVGIDHASRNIFTIAVEAQLGIFWGHFWGYGVIGGCWGYGVDVDDHLLHGLHLHGLHLHGLHLHGLHICILHGLHLHISLHNISKKQIDSTHKQQKKKLKPPDRRKKNTEHQAKW